MSLIYIVEDDDEFLTTPPSHPISAKLPANIETNKILDNFFIAKILPDFNKSL